MVSIEKIKTISDNVHDLYKDLYESRGEHTDIHIARCIDMVTKHAVHAREAASECNIDALDGLLTSQKYILEISKHVIPSEPTNSDIRIFLNNVNSFNDKTRARFHSECRCIHNQHK